MDATAAQPVIDLVETSSSSNKKKNKNKNNNNKNHSSDQNTVVIDSERKKDERGLGGRPRDAASLGSIAKRRRKRKETFPGDHASVPIPPDAEVVDLLDDNDDDNEITAAATEAPNGQDESCMHNSTGFNPIGSFSRRDRKRKFPGATATSVTKNKHSNKLPGSEAGAAIDVDADSHCPRPSFQQHQQQQEQQQRPRGQGSPSIVLDPGDKARMTTGLVSAIHNAAAALSGSATDTEASTSVASTTDRPSRYAWTCLSWATAGTADTDAIAAFLPQHIQQPDSWSCGYRNYQMMLSALLPRLLLLRTRRAREPPEHHFLFSKLPLRLPPTPTELPTVKQLQGSLERFWEEGRDPEGARHYRHSLSGKTGRGAKIGALEVAHLCWYHGIDAAVLQFIRCPCSRGMLPYLVLAYFARNPRTLSCHSAPSLAGSLLSEAARLSSEFASPVPALPERTVAPRKPSGVHGEGFHVSPPLPLYLQWEGHSVTVVGIEADVGVGPTHDERPAFRLLVLDPLAPSGGARSDLPSSASLPWGRIRHRDLQIVLCTERSLAYPERSAVPEGRIFTASEEAVLRAALG